ncbi:TAXI family TRAP transporter solute-binding subunit [candidate division KSB1 bacterium]|nr:TAXI family TRAP transporter solute-binding subunit [candidate division KSB1 bacterium]
MEWQKFKAVIPLHTIFLAFFLLTFAGCGSKQREYRFAAGSTATSYYTVAKSIAEILHEQDGIQMHVLNGPVQLDGESLILNSTSNCRLLAKHKVEFGIAQNDVTFSVLATGEKSVIDAGIRTILPLYPEIFFMIYKDGLRPKSLSNLVVGRTVAMGPRNSGTAKFTQFLFEEFGIDSTQYHTKYLDYTENCLFDSIDIHCMVTGFSNPRISNLLSHGGKLYSLGEHQLANRGSAIDGFCMKYPLAKPYIIPKNIYGNTPPEPVLTAAIDAVLLTRDDIEDMVVMRVLKAILDNKQVIAVDLKNKLLSQITENFDPLHLRFPLHPGARRYLERDKPSFLERYAEMYGFILSFLLAAFGGITTFARWNSRRKKNRIDVYYKKIMVIQKQLDDMKTIEACKSAISKLRRLRENAFEQLITEKLRADESFRIFITYLNDIQTEIRMKIYELKEPH